MSRIKKSKDLTTKYDIGIYQILENKTISIGNNNILLQNKDVVFCPNNLQIKKKLINTVETDFKQFNENTDLNHKKVLIQRYGGIGDILCSIPAIYALKHKFPKVSIGYMCSPTYMPILKKFDNLIDGVSPTVVDYKDIKSFHHFISLEKTVEMVKDHNKHIHEIYANELFVNINKDMIQEIIKNYNQPNIIRKGIGIQYKSNAYIRDYDLENIIIIINKLKEKYPNEPIYLLGKPDDYLNINYIQIKTDGRFISNGCGSYPLTYYQSFDLISKLKLVIAPDSSAVHMAGFNNTPIIGLYGPFTSISRISNYKNAYGIDGISSCQPCMRHHPTPWCIWNSGRCLNLDNIDPNDVFNLSCKILEEYN